MAVGPANITAPRMSGVEFRAFQETRPDHERWELIKGVPVKMERPTILHQFVVGNLTGLLRNSLAGHVPSRLAISCVAVELGEDALASSGNDYRPEPDVVVLDADFGLRQRFVERAYLVAEIVSDTDHQPVPGEKEPWIAIKRQLYLSHPPCETVILVDPYRVEVNIDIKTSDGWISAKLTRLEDQLIVPSCGLKCLVGDVYLRTPLNR
jgi:Uma2 family endonuclease